MVTLALLLIVTAIARTFEQHKFEGSYKRGSPLASQGFNPESLLDSEGPQMMFAVMKWDWSVEAGREGTTKLGSDWTVGLGF